MPAAYPVVLTRLASGREVLIHCPDYYGRLEIEDARTGERLTQSKDRLANQLCQPFWLATQKSGH
jgi:hypothetical protein